MARDVAVGGKKKNLKGKNFFRATWSELKKVHWPDRKTVVRYTLVVLSTVIVMTLFFYIIDMILSFGLKKII